MAPLLTPEALLDSAGTRNPILTTAYLVPHNQGSFITVVPEIVA